MNRLSLRNNWSKFKASGKLPIIVEKPIDYASAQYRETDRKVTTGN